MLPQEEIVETGVEEIPLGRKKPKKDPKTKKNPEPDKDVIVLQARLRAVVTFFLGFDLLCYKFF